MPWDLTGNAGTNPLPIGIPGETVNFLGTTDNKGLTISTNRVRNPDPAMFITPALTRESTGNVGIGTEQPKARLHVIGARGSQSAAEVGGDSAQFQALLARLPKRFQRDQPPFQNRAIKGAGGDIGVEGEGSIWGVIGRGVPGLVGSPVSGVYGTSDTWGAGVSGLGGGFWVNGVSGLGGPSGDGVSGLGGRFGDGVVGSVGGPGAPPAGVLNAGVIGTAAQPNGTGVKGEANNGPLATGVWGASTSGYAGWFSGNVNVQGQINKAAVAFKIDHPLDPENKYLLHSGVESPDMKNVYDGTCRLDKDSGAWIGLPEWFGELNRDYRYQLTAIGGPAPDLHIAQEISENRFRIAGGTAEMSVSWQVTGIRKDPWAQRNRIVVEEDKPEEARGTYLYPEAFGQPEMRGEGYAREEEFRSRQEERLARGKEFRERVAQMEAERPGRPEGGEEPQGSS
jgi:hypothetical protein